MADHVQTLPATQNPLDKEEKQEQFNIKDSYTEQDEKYLSFMQGRLESAKRNRDQVQVDYGNKTYLQYFEENEKIANTLHLEEKKNEDDVVVSAGTIEQKLDALLSNINNLNLAPEVFAFDKQNNRIATLGKALEDIIHDTEIREGADGGGDEEKKMLRQRELLKQGTVFVQEEWLKVWETKKTLSRKYSGEFTGFTDAISGKLEKVFEGPSRTLLYGPNVYLGDITEFYNENQPYIFVVIQKSYTTARKVYQHFENWKFVQAGKIPASSSTVANTIFNNRWRLTDLKKDQVEIILYQDQEMDEFQILINGVPMLPIGFPLSAVSPGGKYNITKQIFRVLNDKFAYGGSFVSSGSVKEISKVIDEMLKLFVLKTRKSFTPAYVNTSGRVIDRKVLSPGRISMGFDPSSLTPIDSTETQGVTAGELGVLREMQSLINLSTVSDQFTGKKGKTQQTATEVVALQRQARLTLGLTIAVCALLEKKLAYLRLWNILENWFEPVGTRVAGADESRKVVNVFRRTNRETNIEGEGLGTRMVVVTEGELPSGEVIRALERGEEDKSGKPVRRVFINRDGLRTAKVVWYIVINAQERESSPFFKLMFKEMLGDMLTLMQFGSVPNRSGLEEEFAQIWGKSKAKLFKEGNPVSPDLAGVSAADGAKSPQQNQNAQGRGNKNLIPEAVA